jgi:hypothetical protein
VTKLELLNAEMHVSDMQNRIKYCPKLKILHFCRLKEQLSRYVNAREIIAILAPLSNRLEELYLDFGPKAQGDDAIQFMSHFSALRILDTTSNMWSHLLSYDVGGEDIATQHLLTNRLPTSLSTLIFHARGNIPSAENDLLHVAQM